MSTTVVEPPAVEVIYPAPRTKVKARKPVPRAHRGFWKRVADGVRRFFRRVADMAREAAQSVRRLIVWSYDTAAEGTRRAVASGRRAGLRLRRWVVFTGKASWAYLSESTVGMLLIPVAVMTGLVSGAWLLGSAAVGLFADSADAGKKKAKKRRHRNHKADALTAGDAIEAEVPGALGIMERAHIDGQDGMRIDVDEAADEHRAVLDERRKKLTEEVAESPADLTVRGRLLMHSIYDGDSRILAESQDARYWSMIVYQNPEIKEMSSAQQRKVKAGFRQERTAVRQILGLPGAAAKKTTQSDG